MSFLLDTNVISEWNKDVVDPSLRQWIVNTSEEELFLSVVTIGELRYGIERLPAGRRRRDLEAWFSLEIRERFSGRILAVDIDTADVFGQILARRNVSRQSSVTMDVWIAATAVVNDLTVVTRNTRDFEALDVPLLNPWLERE